MSESIVHVEWVDAICRYDDVPEEWMERMAELGGVATVSVGILVRSNRRCLMIAETMFTDATYRNILCIPRGMIKKITYLEPRDA